MKSGVCRMESRSEWDSFVFDLEFLEIHSRFYSLMSLIVLSLWVFVFNITLLLSHLYNRIYLFNFQLNFTCSAICSFQYTNLAFTPPIWNSLPILLSFFPFILQKIFLLIISCDCLLFPLNIETQTRNSSHSHTKTHNVL